jgi:hypothetical protein
VTGGAAVALAPAAESRGATWSEDGTIIYTPSGGPNTNLLKIPAGGGTPTPAVTLEEGESSQRWPHVLPGGRAVLFTSTRISGQGAAGGRFDDAQIIVQRLPEGQRTVVWRGGYFARYVPTGHVLYIHRGTLFALPFDVDRLESTGQPVPVLDGISASTTTGAAQLAFANDGTLIFLAGRSTGSEAPLVWLDRAGNTAPWCAETHPRLRSGAVVELEYPAEPLTALNHA